MNRNDRSAGCNQTNDLAQDFVVREMMRNPEQFVSGFMGAPNIGVAILDLDFRFRAVNEALALMNGIPPQAHVGLRTRDVVGELAPKVEPLFRYVHRPVNHS